MTGNSSNNQTGQGGGADGTPQDTNRGNPSAPPADTGGRDTRLNNRNNRNRRNNRHGDTTISTGVAGTVVVGFLGIGKIQAPSEGGSKKKMDDILEKIQSTVIVSWTYGTDVASI